MGVGPAGGRRHRAGPGGRGPRTDAGRAAGGLVADVRHAGVRAPGDRDDVRRGRHRPGGTRRGPIDPGPLRLFCSRRPGKRTCHNAAEVEALFAAHGFTVVFPEDHPLPEQARMVREADVVAGFAGSGMFQIAFAGGPKHVILVGSESYTASNEYLISSVVGHRLDLVLCRPDVAEDGRALLQRVVPVRLHLRRRARGASSSGGCWPISEIRREQAETTPRLRPDVTQTRLETPYADDRQIGLRSERGPILLSVMLATGLVAIDSTILATAVPSIVGDLGGFSQFPWLFSIYLLAQAVSVPLYGKFADLVGRKPMMLLGIAIFLVASVLCGLAWSMVSLIVFRALQGLGAGAVLPMGQTIIGDVYSVAERAKVTGYVAGVWAASSVVGPTLGGVFSDYISWRWIFFVNIPIADRRHGRAPAQLPRDGRAAAAPDRLRRRRAARRRRLAADPRPARGRRGVGVGLPRQHRRALGRGAAAGRLRVRRVARGRAHPAAVGLPPPGAGRRQRHGAVRRRDPDRPDVATCRCTRRACSATAPWWRASPSPRSRSAGRSPPRCRAGSTCGSGSATCALFGSALRDRRRGCAADRGRRQLGVADRLRLLGDRPRHGLHRLAGADRGPAGRRAGRPAAW